MADATRRPRAVFLDRDGTIIDDKDFLDDPKRVELIPGAVAALRRLREAGYLLIVVTNQSGVARGLFTEARLAQVHERMTRLLAAQGVKLDAIYYCPHLPEGTVPPYDRDCECRKPKPGMIFEAARRHGLNLAGSVAVGDAERDIEAGHRAGCRTILVSRDPSTPTRAEAVAGSLAEAAELILAGE